MERLLIDADALSESFNLQVDESGALVYSYADIVDAIHIVQEEMGIAGATAAEASSTIEGSVNSAKASWQNLTVAIANENADVSKSVDEFVESVGIAADNILPRVDIALDGIMKLVDGIIPKIVDTVPQYITKYVPKLIKSGAKILTSLVDGVKKNAKLIVNSAKDVVLTLVDSLEDLIPDMIDAGVELLSGIVQAVPEVAGKIFKAMPKIISSICNGLIAGAVEVVKAAISIFSPIVDQSEIAAEKLEGVLQTVVPFANIVKEYASNTVDLSNALSSSGKTISEIDSNIEETESAITNILKTAFETQQGLRAEDLANIQKYNDEIRAMNEEKLGIYRDQQLAELRKIALDIAEMDEENLAQAVGRAQAALEATNKVTEDMYSQRLIDIENFHRANNTIGSEQYEQELRAAKEHRDRMLQFNKNVYDETLDLVSERSEEIANKNLSSFEETAKLVDSLREQINRYDLDEFINENDAAIRSLGAMDDVVADYANALANLDYDSAKAFLSMQANLVDAGIAIDEESYAMVESILGAFEGLPGELGENGKTALLSLVSGLEDQIPKLKNASEMTADEIISVIRKHLLGQGTTSVFNEFAGKVKSALSGLSFDVNIPVNLRPTPQTNFPVNIDGSHELGLDYVPFDGYVAELHRGERVLTRQEARNYGNQSFGDIVINVQASRDYDEQRLATVIAQKIQTMTDRRTAVYA